MEKQQTLLLEAARVGSIASLQQLLKEDPLILDRAAVNCFNETPLHVAAMLGHVEFVKKVVELKPELVNELNSDGSSPLHLASAKGHADAVEALLRVDTRACMHRDRNQMLPLHLAAAKGRVEAMLLLLQARPEAAAYRGGESILHLCVKRYQVEALKVMVKSSVCSSEFLNSKDGDGNTVLHLAVAEKQVETVTLLVSVGGVEVNAVNNEGMTALDVLIRSRKDVRDCEIEKSLIEADGTTISQEKKQTGSWHTATADSSSNNNNNNNNSNNNNKNKNSRKSLGLMKRHAGWLDRKKDALMVVASVIATIAFQVGVNPPGGVWQEDKLVVDEHGKNVVEHGKNVTHKAGESVWGDKYPDDYLLFYGMNSAAFIASLSIVLLLTSGLPMRRGFFVWILMLVTWIAITAIALCYVFAIDVVAPSRHYGDFTGVISHAVFAWIGLMALLLIAHTIRMILHTIRAIVRLVKKIGKAWMRMRARRHASLTSQNP